MNPILNLIVCRRQLPQSALCSVLIALLLASTVRSSIASEPFAWGWGLAGALGNGSSVNQSTPSAVDMSGVLSGKTIVAVSAGFEFSLALSSDGLVFAWGGNTYGNLGDGTTFQSPTPVAVVTTGVLATKIVIAIDAGADFSAALTSDGLVFTWGHNTNGQLGQGNYTNSNVPGAVVTSGILLGKTVTAISMGTVHGHAVTSTGIVGGWGYNVNGTLADGSAAIRESSPVAIGSTGVMSAKTMVAVSAGDEIQIADFLVPMRDFDIRVLTVQAEWVKLNAAPPPQDLTALTNAFRTHFTGQVLAEGQKVLMNYDGNAMLFTIKNDVKGLVTTSTEVHVE